VEVGRSLERGRRRSPQAWRRVARMGRGTRLGQRRVAGRGAGGVVICRWGTGGGPELVEWWLLAERRGVGWVDEGVDGAGGGVGAG
jgi:hypothetical protein